MCVFGCLRTQGMEFDDPDFEEMMQAAEAMTQPVAVRLSWRHEGRCFVCDRHPTLIRCVRCLQAAYKPATSSASPEKPNA